MRNLYRLFSGPISTNYNYRLNIHYVIGHLWGWTDLEFISEPFVHFCDKFGFVNIFNVQSA